MTMVYAATSKFEKKRCTRRVRGADIMQVWGL
jgi:hypothetical protein